MCIDLINNLAQLTSMGYGNGPANRRHAQERSDFSYLRRFETQVLEIIDVKVRRRYE